jgi:hypothetical protein
LPCGGRVPYRAPKGSRGPKKVNGKTAWIDSKGREWSWDKLHGDHWDVQGAHGDGYQNIGQNGEPVGSGESESGRISALQPNIQLPSGTGQALGVGAGIAAAGAAAWWLLGQAGQWGLP